MDGDKVIAMIPIITPYDVIIKTKLKSGMFLSHLMQFLKLFFNSTDSGVALQGL